MARAVLAAVFATAGVAKLADRRRAAASFTEFGVPEQFSQVAVSALAVAELVCAISVVPSASARFGALGVATLLTLFIGVILWTLARGRRPACACFGQVKSEPIGPRVLLRNTVLWTLAAFVAWDAAPTADTGHVGASWNQAAASFGSASVSAVVALVALVGLAIVGSVLVSVLRQYGRLLIRVERLEQELGISPDAPEPAGLPVGTDAPAFSLTALDGGAVSLAHIGTRATSAVLVFVEPGCAPCGELLPDIAAAQSRSVWLDAPVDAESAGTTSRTAVIVISQGSARENRAKMSPLGIRNVLLQRARETADAYRVVGTPSAVRVTNGLVATELAAGPDAVRTLLHETQSREHGVHPATVGDTVPEMTMADLDGRSVDLRAAARDRTLLLFWSPSCGYCQQMLDTLKAWERRADAREVTLLVVSQGSAESNRDQGLRSRLLLDDNFLVGQAFGVSGTPSAVLLDNGRVASQVAAGATAVFALATPKRVLASQV